MIGKKVSNGWKKWDDFSNDWKKVLREGNGRISSHKGHKEGGKKGGRKAGGMREGCRH
jgi:hypothetical protein